MTNWRSVLGNIATDLQSHVAAARREAAEILVRDPLQIVIYRGYGTAERAFITGRALEDEGTKSTATDSRWRNLINALKRLESDEVPNARIRISYAGAEQVVVSDEEGYFSAWLDPAAPTASHDLWHLAEAELMQPRRANAEAVRGSGQILVPHSSAEFAVISDLDDTVIQTGATDLVRMARATLFENARTRLPFPGVAAFYRALQNGAHGSALNPLFYVSSSPWNLYDLLSEFMQLQEIPVGPLMLRDWDFTLARPRHGPHKLGAIAQIMDLYQDLPVILIGDSGQEDPEIYSEVVARYPKRILAVYIRNVTPNPERSAAIRSLAEEVVRAGSTLILADDSMAAARHAVENGWIASSSLGSISSEKSKEEEGKAGTPIDEPSTQPAPVAPTVVVDATPAGDGGNK